MQQQQCALWQQQRALWRQQCAPWQQDRGGSSAASTGWLLVLCAQPQGAAAHGWRLGAHGRWRQAGCPGARWFAPGTHPSFVASATSSARRRPQQLGLQQIYLAYEQQ